MKYVWWMNRSTGVEAMKMPLRPPMTNMLTNASAKHIGTVKRMLPFQIVPIQLNTLMAEGTAITIVDSENAAESTMFMPDTNMWWPHTMKPRNPMAMMENTIARYPKSGLRANTGRISEISPIAGRIMMYTSGCPKNQNRCCQSSGSPPVPRRPAEEASCRSSGPARASRAAAMSTGTASSSRIAVTKRDHTVRGIRNIVMPGQRMLMMVVM